MSQIVSPSGAGRERTQLVRWILLVLKELTQKTEVDTETRDLVAFLVMTLETIWAGIERSVQPWEKRGYWVKADQFRMKWDWTNRYGQDLYNALLLEDWSSVLRITGMIASKVAHYDSPKGKKLGTPWMGAWERLRG